WRAVVSVAPAAFATAWQQQAERFAKEDRERGEFNGKHFRTFADFRSGASPGWQISGHGLRQGAVHSGDFSVAHEGEDLLNAIVPAGCYTHTLSEKLNGALQSPPLPKSAGRRISIEVMGEHASAVRLVTNNCQLNTTHYEPLAAEQLQWLTF